MEKFQKGRIGLEKRVAPVGFSRANHEKVFPDDVDQDTKRGKLKKACVSVFLQKSGTSDSGRQQSGAVAPGRRHNINEGTKTTERKHRPARKVLTSFSLFR
jgi:hypothetical protein